MSFGLVVYLKGDIRFDSNIISELSDLGPKIKCGQGYEEIEAIPCTLGDQDSSELIIAVGDSHMGQWADALHQIGTEKNIRVDMFSKAACANSSIEYFYEGYGKIYTECTAWKKNVAREIIKRNPKIIFLTNSSAGYVKIDGNYPTLTDWGVGVSRFLDEISGSGYKIVWLGDNPRFWRFNPQVCYQRQLFFGESHQQSCASARDQSINSNILDVERDVVLGKSAMFVDFTNFYCDAVKCNSIIQDVPIMRDGNHLTSAATMMLKEELKMVFQPLLR